jgi:hypothetical protein
MVVENSFTFIPAIQEISDSIRESSYPPADNYYGLLMRTPSPSSDRTCLYPTF